MTGGGPVPAGFAATSVTFVSVAEAFVLGTAPCAHAPCTSIVRTLDRGASWAGMPAPVVPLGDPYDFTGRAAAWGIRFASPGQGFVFGNGLWVTTDGGEHWTAAASPPGGVIVDLEVIDGQLLALTDACTAQSGCAQGETLERRALSGGPWSLVTRVSDARADRHPGAGRRGARRRQRGRHRGRRAHLRDVRPPRATRRPRRDRRSR